MNVNMGSSLSTLRLSKGLSQEELAAEVGVSRQAVSNWERSESVPDTENLLRLADFYGITLDELTARTSSRGETQHARHGERGDDRWRNLSAFLACLIISAVYYALVAQPLVMSIMDDITEMFGLVLSPTLAVAWLVAEILFVAVPFVVTAVVPLRMPRWIWAAPLVAFVTPALLAFGAGVIGGSAAGLEYSGIGGALSPSVAIKADVVALILGCSFLITRQSLRRGAVHPTGSQPDNAV